MSDSPQRILITGGSGFIGSALVLYILDNTPHHVINLDKMTYAANPASLKSIKNHPNYTFVQGDIADAALLHKIFTQHTPTGVMHLAAESHVDRSIDAPEDFIQTNLVGTATLLEAARTHWQALPEKEKTAFRFHHISTDEVFGSLEKNDPAFTETTRYDPRSPYSASKAGSDHLISAWHHTYGLPTVISNCSNNYGPRQSIEKLIPLMVAHALHGAPLPIYGTGENIRDWLHVEDHAKGLFDVLQKGAPGQSYNLGGNTELTNKELVLTLCEILDELHPASTPYASTITYVTDRPGHDKRYAMDTTFTEKQLGWKAQTPFKHGLRQTIQWYLNNQSWWLADYKTLTQRQGLSKQTAA